ncbi:RNA-binding protein [Halomonas denitrificans]|uniref:RNA-binding S4 domain-containing protein n=1 Tax=Halomonas TaxID=2745 RepID=UPI001A8D702A|nr:MULTISPECIES: S4 domain-containing protein [Halomonas]MBN8412187.1 RNA-binding protein [Halomonas litopenaei]MED5294788.1 S4 domain-containing protein [Pseudomonadota bacterium]MBY5924463.1 RNA-binding protein [Halomonas sp. DP4Y7-2]MBY5929826.1 RNA-binding protein [Halomonas sp. DP8Y7-3]MBY5968424.1 RNA-binding protein [Halomonas denitrificans]
MDSVRLDKWLWAARFFKTRALAKKAIEGGKVEVDGAKAKTSKLVSPGMRIRAPQGWDVWEVEVVQVSEQRRGAPEARLLYQETEQSRERREREAEQRRQANEVFQHPHKRPDKRARRDIKRFQREGGS